jgi:hypothetical protein
MEDDKGAAEMVDRKEGYYWVRYKSGSEWTPAKWLGVGKAWNWWVLNGEAYYDSDLHEIDERQICRS